MKELGAWDRAVATKSVHHPRIRCYGNGVARCAMAKRECEHELIRRQVHLYPQKNIATITITYQKPSSVPRSYQPSILRKHYSPSEQLHPSSRPCPGRFVSLADPPAMRPSSRNLNLESRRANSNQPSLICVLASNPEDQLESGLRSATRASNLSVCTEPEESR
jgi:hypothetical protein